MLIPWGVLTAGVVGAGYFAGISATYKITFDTDSVSTLSPGLNTPTARSAGFANSQVAGYVLGGFALGGINRTSRIEKLNFSSDAYSTLSAALSGPKEYFAGAANSGVAGYVAGGIDSTDTSAIEKLTFSTEARSTLAATLASVVYDLAGMANSGTAAYFAGGLSASDGIPKNRIDKLTFSSDTRSTLSATLSQGLRSFAGLANSGVAGYFAGGQVSGGSYTSNLEKLTFSSDTRSTSSSWLSVAKGELAGASNSGVAGYFAGGYTGSATSTVEKINFANDARSITTSLPANQNEATGFANAVNL